MSPSQSLNQRENQTPSQPQRRRPFFAHLDPPPDDNWDFFLPELPEDDEWELEEPEEYDEEDDEEPLPEQGDFWPEDDDFDE